MSVKHVTAQIEYPESDGRPMGETDLHIEWIIRIRDILKLRYRGRQVYVANDLLVYYEQGNPRKFFVPDCFVVKDCHPGPRRTFKTWQEGKAPDVVLEITSVSTKSDDSVLKPQLYARLGIKEYFLFDPTSDYLQPALQGYRLAPTNQNEYLRIKPDDDGALISKLLGLSLRLQGADLVMSDVTTGQRLLTESEAEHAAREEVEAELARVREQLKRLKGEN